MTLKPEGVEATGRCRGTGAGPSTRQGHESGGICSAPSTRRRGPGAKRVTAEDAGKMRGKYPRFSHALNVEEVKSTESVKDHPWQK